MGNSRTDSTEKANTRESLPFNNKLLLSIFHTMPASVTIVNSKLEVVMCNERAYKIFGCLTEVNFLEKFTELSPLYQPDGTLSAEGLVQNVADASRKGTISFSWMHCDVDGNPIPFSITLAKLDIVDEYGGYYVVGYLQDMRPILSQNAVESRYNKKIRALLDAIPLSYVVWTKDLRTIMCNKKAYELVGLQSEAEHLSMFNNLSPSAQPNGNQSTALAQSYVKIAFEKGYLKFKWLQMHLNGEEIPTEITLVRIRVEDEEDIVAAFAQDLRGNMAGETSHDDDQFESYFLNHISDKVLFNTVASLSNELFFALDIRTSYIQYFGNNSNMISRQRGKILFPDSIIARNIIHPDDSARMIALGEKIKKGILDTADIRFSQEFGKYHYFRIIYQFVFNTKNEPIFAIGKASDIHEQKTVGVACVNRFVDVLLQ